MSRDTWVVQRGQSVAGDPATLPFRYAPVLYDTLTVGPHHLDAPAEQQLRRAAGMPSDLDLVDEHQSLLGQDVVLLVERELAAVLGALWWIDVLSQRGADVSGVRLAIAPSGPASVVVRAVRDALPIGSDVEPLRALRRAIAADDDTMSLPIDAVSEARRPWASVAARILDLLPDARGLDRDDARLLEQVGRDWTGAAYVVGNTLAAQDREHRTGDLTLWDRLRLLAEDRPAKHWRDVIDSDQRTSLVELELHGASAMRFARARRAPFGEQVLAGRDALDIRAFDRWVGGRFLTRERILRGGLRRG
ncbi:MAG: hypothetical protein M3Y87_07780 [Myxococcota bacterium]|nr:hypothetical protein [Myxococcota bacterium]